MNLQGYKDLMQGSLANYLQLSAKIGGDVAKHAQLIQQAFQAQYEYLTITTQSSKPTRQSVDDTLLEPTTEQIRNIQEYREKNRSSPFFNHLSAISESIPALGWVKVTPAPGPFVKEMNDAGQFYTNRVLKDWKEKDKTHVEWARAWIQTLSELQAYIKQYHTTGLVWTGSGSALISNESQVLKGGKGSAPPPPPPSGMPPPPPVLDFGDGAPIDLSQDRNALFAEINRGEDITKSLKKVTSEMQTHKNPGLRSGPAPFKAPQSNDQVSFKPVAAAKAPVLTKEGKKWRVEHHKGNREIIIDQVEMNNVVYIYNCQDSTIRVKGKINSIFVDSCKKTAVAFDNLVSSIEFINCINVQMQVIGTVPTISIDKTDGCQMYLSDNSLNVEIISAKSTEMNVLIPKDNGDFSEYPIPEQFKTTVNKRGLTTVAVESKG